MRLVNVHTDHSAKIALFECLQKRPSAHSISHRALPTFDEHCRFVDSRPYRFWYLIESDGDYIGSVYVTEMNDIGLFMTPGNTPKAPEAIKQVLSTHRPLPAIRSKRIEAFSINVNPGNLDLIQSVEATGGRHVQNTYIFPSN